MDIQAQTPMNKQTEKVINPFLPVFDSYSKILILGSMPSAKSRETKFYYGHQRNRFWRVLSCILQWEHTPENIQDKKNMILKNNIALWDVIASCRIRGSSDSSITDVKINNIKSIIDNSNIKKLYANGNLAYNLYMKYCFSDTNMKITKLPSTSPANAVYNVQKLIDYWNVVVE